MEHLKADLGNLEGGSTVVVTLDKQANVLLMDSSNYRTYAAGRGGQFRYYGGLMKRSPARIPVPTSAHWYLAIDLAGRAGRIRHSISVQPPPRADLPEYREPNGSLADRVAVRQPEPPASEEELDGRTWDELPAQSNSQEQILSLW